MKNTSNKMQNYATIIAVKIKKNSIPALPFLRERTTFYTLIKTIMAHIGENRALIFSILFLSVIQYSCKTTTKTVVEKPNAIAQSIDTSAILEQGFTGLLVYDADENKVVFERNVNQFFTPASNTKLLTYYACMKTLGDSIPAFRYVLRGDSLIFWGTGNPTFLHPDFNDTLGFNFLKNQAKTKKLYFSDANFTNSYLGSGWAWDDYNDDYSAEISPFPIYGNIVRATIKNAKTKLNPRYFDTLFIKKNGGTFIQRDVNANRFTIPNSIAQKSDYQQDIPFKTSTDIFLKLMSDTLKQPVNLVKIPIFKDAQTFFSIPTEGVYRRMLQVSDNMLAEHLLLLCGVVLKDTINTSFTIKTIIEKNLKDLPDVPKWIDGSGLSRYNLMTPRLYVRLLQKMLAEIPREKLFSVLAVGGQNGTLSNVYVNNGNPYVFGKSGSMSGVYNLSGYLISKKKKTFIFSFMNNNFTKSVSQVRREVERILTNIYNTN